MDMPTVSFDLLWHVGSLRIEDKKNDSFEGQGLSVSLHPEEWSQIARLSGPTWEVTPSDGGAFCDYHALTDAQREMITRWGLDNGYIQEQTVFEVSWFDDEFDRQMSTYFLTEEDAIDEIDGDEEMYDVVAKVLAVATEMFPDPCVNAGDINPHQILTTLWVQDNTDLNGVYWDDDYDPECLSASRGVIFQNKTKGWTFQQA